MDQEVEEVDFIESFGKFAWTRFQLMFISAVAGGDRCMSIRPKVYGQDLYVPVKPFFSSLFTRLFRHNSGNDHARRRGSKATESVDADCP